MHKQDILKLLTFPGFKKLWCGGHTAYARTIFNHSRTYSSIFKTLVRWSSHSSTYSFISKFWCGGRATQAHILSFQNSGAVAEPLTHIFFHFKILVRWPSHLRTYFPLQNSGAVAEPLTHIFFHFKILVRWPNHSRTYSFILKFWCGGRATHAQILSSSKFWYGGRTTHVHISLSQNSGAVTEPLTHVSHHVVSRRT